MSLQQLRLLQKRWWWFDDLLTLICEWNVNRMKSYEWYSEVKRTFESKFWNKRFGAAKKILHTKILSGKKCRFLQLSKKKYIEKVLRCFNMHETKPINTPFAAHFKLSSTLSPNIATDMTYMTHVPYSSAIRSLMYVMIHRKPNLVFIVSMVRIYMEDSGKEHWKSV